MLSREQLLEQLRLQDQLNQRVHPNWRSQGFSWTRAAMVEATELLDHVGWKWWKQQELELDQAQLELVDIWHFILSDGLVTYHGDCDMAAASLHRPIAEKLVYSVYTGINGVIDLRQLSLRQLIHVFAGMAAFDNMALGAFDLIREKLGLSWDDLHRMYLGKNLLNIFRQQHGYQDGTYAKIWGRYGEDNKVLAELLALKPDATADELMAELESLYNEVIESAQA